MWISRVQGVGNDAGVRSGQTGPAMQLLWPDHHSITPDEWAADERPGRLGRPWVEVCMVTTIDGATALGGRSGGLGGPTDAAVLGALRRQADVIVVGAGTVRAERYGRPRKPGQRVGVVTARGAVDATSELFCSGAGFVITSEEAEVAAGVDVVRAGRGEVDLVAALASLGPVVADPRVVHVEGGPRLNGAMLAAGLVDEVNLTVAPRLAGGDSERLTVGAPEHDDGAAYELRRVARSDEGLLLARWRRR